MSLDPSHFYKNDGRKYELVEGPDGTATVVDITPPPKLSSGGEGWARKRVRKVREQMKKRTSKETKPYTWRLGYNHCIGQFVQDDYPSLSGSSLNRKKRPPTTREKKAPSDNCIHVFSTRSRGKVKDKATSFFRSAKGDRIFLTLTFIQHLADKDAVGILNKFLTVLRKERPGLQYLWVAEPQEENNNRIHFHILLNKRLTIKRYNALWVLQQYNAGLVGKSKSGEAISKQEIERRYQIDMNSKSKKADGGIMELLNPVDIEPAYNIYGLSFYLTEYITKQKKHEFGCLAWHCSRKVSSLFTREVVGPSAFRYMMSFRNFKVDRKTGECWIPTVVQKKFFTMVYVNNKGAPLTMLKQLEIVNKWIMRDQLTPDKIRLLDDRLYKRLFNDGYVGDTCVK